MNISGQGIAFLNLVAGETARAQALHGKYVDFHHGYAVFREEHDEFWDEIKKRKQDKPALLRELVQIAAVCTRMADELIDPEIFKTVHSTVRASFSSTPPPLNPSTAIGGA